jgi:2-oxo-3-(phosphooxy)propyl 3-oxoalkanoate synthase
MSASTFGVECTTTSPARTDDRTSLGHVNFGRTAPLHPTGAPSHYPSLTTTVPKEFVHRAAVAEVMLTDWERHDDTRFAVSAQWPRSHSFFTPVQNGHHDPLIAAETIRQVGSLLAHAEFGIPLGHQFLMWDLSLAVHPREFLVGDAPASLDIAVQCTDISRRAGKVAGFRIEVAIRRDGRLAATGGGSFTGISPAVYRRLRGSHALGERRPVPLTAPAAPQHVGRMSPMDVVLSPAGEPNHWQLRVETRHPVLFDHPVDHVPGMVLLEAARQSSAAALGRSSFMPLSVSCEFTRYTELDVPCLIEAHRLPRTAPADDEVLLVTGRQDDELVFSATVTAAPLAA